MGHVIGQSMIGKSIHKGLVATVVTWQVVMSIAYVWWRDKEDKEDLSDL